MAAPGEELVESRRAAVSSWRFARFEDLSPRETHDMYRLRAAVFIVEQSCVFQDVDGADPACWHLLGRAAPAAGGEGALIAYCRLVPAGIKFPEPSIGRVITAREARGTGAGRALMREAIARAQKLWPGAAIRIGAQSYLKAFYESYGFVQCSEPYEEDGILHIEMIREGK